MTVLFRRRVRRHSFNGDPDVPPAGSSGVQGLVDSAMEGFGTALDGVFRARGPQRKRHVSLRHACHGIYCGEALGTTSAAGLVLFKVFFSGGRASWMEQAESRWTGSCGGRGRMPWPCSLWRWCRRSALCSLGCGQTRMSRRDDSSAT